MSEFLEKIDLNKILHRLLFIFLTLMAQNMVFSHIRLFGVKPMLLPSAAAAVGMFEGATWGPLFSLVMGYFADMSFVEHRVFFLLVLPLPLDPVFKGCMLMLAATPCASIILNLAEMHHNGQEFAANCCLLTTLLSILTIPLLSLLI